MKKRRGHVRPSVKRKTTKRKKKKRAMVIERNCHTCTSDRPLKSFTGQACLDCGAIWLTNPEGLLVAHVKGFPKVRPCLICSKARLSVWPGDRNHIHCRELRSESIATEFFLMASGNYKGHGGSD